MGRVFLQEFEKTKEDYFYVCRMCNTHIVLLRNLRHYLHENGQVTGHVFSHVINVHTYSPAEDRKVSNRTITDIYCNNCCYLLGFKFIKVAADDEWLRVGDFLIDLDKLRIWEDYEGEYPSEN